MVLRLYNSLSETKELFLPLQKNTVRLYVCGITPYNTTHLGHAFTYISFDLLFRYLRYLGYNVIYTQNVTDINDRDNDILKYAKEQQLPWQNLAAYWTKKFLSDMRDLNWVPPINYLKASDHIATMIMIIKKILHNGIAYTVNGSVFLDIQKFTNFGELCRLTQEQMFIKAKEFEEDITNSNKRHPLDITLWRAAAKNQPSHIPSFMSPWGKGRPGWHLECSAMAIETLGEQIDIHGGGVDLIYPHHESEIAQSESATGKKPFAKYWIHTGTVHLNGQKMSKSLGNLVLVSDLLKKYSPEAIRFVLLFHHYRVQWNFEESEFEKAEAYLDLLRRSQQKKDGISILKKAKELLNNDLDTPSVLQLIIDAATEGNTAGLQDVLKLLGFPNLGHATK